MKTLILLSILLLAGCTSNHLVPKTKITWNARGANIELPKDMTAESIDVLRSENGVSVRIHNIKVRTNPEVIGAAGAAQAEAIDAVGKQINNAWEKALKLKP